MSFATALALLVGLLVAAPVAAHFLRRGRAEEREFPPARWVSAEKPIAHQRSRLEDRALLGVRAAMAAVLAILGATPLVRCSGLTVARNQGASVALAIVIDDSLSMRAPLGRETRFDRASALARELAGTLRSGDAVSVVLAGTSARLALAATTDLDAAAATLSSLTVSDRGTDVAGAVELARGSLATLPHLDKRVVIFSDRPGDARPGRVPLWAPAPELVAATDDCAVVRAARRGGAAEVVVACSTAAAATGRNVTAGGVRAPLEPRAGVQTFELAAPPDVVEASLDGHDAIASDDRGALAPSAELQALVVSDPASSSVVTGGPPIVEQALTALGGGVMVRPLAALPERADELDAAGLLVLDDPTAFSPEGRTVITDWLTSGHVALALLGPHVDTVQLGSSLDPFAGGALRWTPGKATGIDVTTAAWLGEEAAGLATLAATHRVELAASDPDRVLAAWSDGMPFVVERAVGRGLALVVGLPAATEYSELALRPAFLALLDHAVRAADERGSARARVVGSPWLVPEAGNVSVVGPAGPVPLEDARGARRAVPSLAGKYELTLGETHETRIAFLDAEEITTPEHALASEPDAVVGLGPPRPVDVSREVAIALLGLFVLELVLRVWRGRKRRPQRRDGDAVA